MDPLDEQTAFRASIGVNRSRVPAYVVIAAAVLVAGLGFLANVTGDGTGEASPPLPTTSAPAAAATPRPTLPTPAPTPVPTLAPVAAPVTTAELSPTGVFVAGTGDPAFGGLVADVNGTIWANRAGGVANVDPQTGRTREWTLADDPAFATAVLAPARQGGVWLVSPGVIRLFDGERFRAVIESPGSVWQVVEGSDGGLWATTGTYGLIRWADGTWTSDPPGRPTRGAASIAVDADGKVWTTNNDQHADGEWTSRGISTWDGSAWTTFTAENRPELADLGRSIPSLVAAGDGSLWVVTERHLARFHAGSWTRYDVADLASGVPPSTVDEDGRLWFVREDCEGCAVRIEVLDGSTLTTYTDQDGLPGAADVDWPWATILSGPGYLVAATEAGLYRLADGSWQRLETSAPSGRPAPGSNPTRFVAAIAAMSRNEIWAANWPTGSPQEDELFRFDRDTWQRQRLPVETTVGQVVVGPDGALWAATASGPLVRRDGDWIDLGDTVARVVPEPGEDGTTCGGTVVIAGDGVAYYAGPRSGNRLVTLQPVGDSWEASLHPAPPLGDPCQATLAVTADGAIWLLQPAWGTTLRRSAGGPWEVVPLSPEDQPGVDTNTAAITVDRYGSLWAVVNTLNTNGAVRADVMELVGGQWVSRGGGEGVEYVRALALLPDGSLIAIGDGIARFDGQRWRHWWHGLRLNAVSVAPDGTVWVAGPNVYRLPPSLP
jgi:hypothetical protein